MTMPTTLLVLLAGSLLASPALAEPEAPSTPARAPTDRAGTPGEVPAIGSPMAAGAQQDSATRFSLSAEGLFETTSDLKDGPGSVQINRVSGGFGVSHDFNPKLRGLFNISSEASWYHFDDAGRLFGGTSPGHVTTLATRISPGASYKIDEHWTVLGGGIVDISGESGADVGESVTGGGYVGARYRFSDALALTFGVQAQSRLEDDARVLPLVGIEWRISDQVRLSTRGAGLRLEGNVAKRCTVYAEGYYSSREYRLDDANPVSEGVLRDSSLPILFGTSYRCTDRFEFSLAVGVVAYRQLRTDDRTGTRVAEIDAKPAAIFNVAGTFKF